MSNIKIKVKKLDGDLNYFNFILKMTWVFFFQKICKMLKTSM